MTRVGGTIHPWLWRVTVGVASILPLPPAMAGERLGVAVPYLPQGSLVNFETEDAVQRLILANTSGTLTRVNRQGDVEPELAREVRRSADGKRWDLFLRIGVRFTGGRAISSTDVERSFALLRERTKDRFLLNIREMRTDFSADPTRITFELEKQDPNFDRELGRFPVIDTAIAEGAGELLGTGTFLPYSGPFWVKENRPGTVLILESSDSFFSQELGRPSSLEVRPYADAREALSALRVGTVAIIAVPTGAQIEAAKKDPTLEVLDSPFATMGRIRTEREFWSPEEVDSDRLALDKILVRRGLQLDENAFSRFDLRGTFLR